MAFNDPAESSVASLASQGLFDPATLTIDEMRAICAAALTRVPDHRQQEIFQARPIYEQIDIALAAIRLAEPSAEVAKVGWRRSPVSGDHEAATLSRQEGAP